MAENESDAAPDPQDFTDPSPDPANDGGLAILGDALQEQNVTRVVIRYAGYGDSGAVEEIEHEPGDIHLPSWIESNLRNLAEGYCPDGYANNDGGYGSLTVYPFLGLAELEHYDRYEDTTGMETQTATLPEELRRRLSRRGVQSVTAHFDGYGDSGQIDDVTVEPESVALGDALRQALENFLLDRLPGGWEINEGSYGDFAVNVPTGQVDVDASWRIEKDSDAQVTRWQWRK